MTYNVLSVTFIEPYYSYTSRILPLIYLPGGITLQWG